MPTNPKNTVAAQSALVSNRRLRRWDATTPPSRRPLCAGRSRGSHRHIVSAPRAVGNASSDNARRQPQTSATSAVPTRPTKPPNTSDEV